MERLIRLDVSELEAPEPLVRALAALRQLPPGHCLQMVHRMKPCLLYDNIVDLDIVADTREGEAGDCEVYLWHRDDPVGEQIAREASSRLSPWRD